MISQIVKLKIITALFLSCFLVPLFAQDAADIVPHVTGERHSSGETRQHYLQGKEFYSQGRYEEARVEFERALESVAPPRLGTEKTTEQQKALEITPAKIPAPEEKAIEKKEEEKEEAGKAGEVTKAEMAQAPAPEAESAQDERQYYIDFGDVLDISVWELPQSKEKMTQKKTTEQKGDEYHINFGDVLDISVWQVPDLTRSEVIVRPDGKISFPLIGDEIHTEGLTLAELDNIITEELKTYVKNPKVSIMLRRFGRQEQGVGRAVRSDLSLAEAIVRPDGKISLPLIGDIKAEGLTFAQLDNVITEELKTYVAFPEVSIMLRNFGGQANKVIVLGEVLGPGVYKFNATPTITEVIASAGGYTKYAVLNSVMIIRGNGGDVRIKPKAIRVSVANILRTGRLKENIFLRPNDIVYVPRSFIGKINTFLEVIQPAISEYMQTLDARRFHNVVHRN